MSKSVKIKVGLIVLAILALIFANGAVFHFYPGDFSVFAYVLFLFIPLALSIIIIFTKFSLLFIKNVEEEREENKLLQERQRDIVENITEGLVIHDKKENILMMNKTAERLLGIGKTKFRGEKSVKEMKNHSDLFAAMFADFKEGEISECVVNDGKGKESYYNIIKITLNKERGEILKIIRDVSRSKYLDRMKTEYVTIMSHRFFTPLTNIKWSTDFLLSDSQEAGKNKENLKNILNNVEKLVNLTSSLLDITEMEEGFFGYNFEKLDMNVILEEAFKNFHNYSEEKKVKMIYQKPKDGQYFVTGDRNRLIVAISNYLDNAIKYTPENGQVVISVDKKGEELKVNVADTGVGVFPESAQSLFTKFFRDKWAKSMHTEGSGLGLFIVKNIIEQHGGKVGYEANGNNGSIFFFTLPLWKEGQNTDKNLK